MCLKLPFDGKGGMLKLETAIKSALTMAEEENSIMLVGQSGAEWVIARKGDAEEESGMGWPRIEVNPDGVIDAGEVEIPVGLKRLL
jgi:hypothetical protein